MKTTITMIIATALIAGAGSTAYAESCADAGEFYSRADANSDGVITKAEVRNMRSTTFSRLDRNGDGVAEPSDAPRRFKDRYMEKFEPVRAKFDQNGDGRISEKEFLDAPMTGFDRADQNGDGQLTKNELRSLTGGAC
ncbi:MAG: hypothetical protein AAFX54_10990 [Pseudomonadota bacterium]